MQSHVDSRDEGHSELKTGHQLLVPSAPFKDVADPSDGTQIVHCLQHVEHGSKNCKGLVHQVHLENKLVCHYAETSRGDIYISKLSDVAESKDLFYSKPKKFKFTKDDPCWFYDTLIGHDVLSRKLTNTFIAAVLDYECIHNHSLRAMGISGLYHSGKAEKLIMERLDT